MNPFVSTKLHYHPDRVAQWMETGDTVPVCAEIDMTNYCTDRCPCCAGGRTRGNARLDTDRALRLVDEFRDMGVKAVCFTGGGEPLLHPDTIAVMKHAQSQNLDTALVTNGLLLDVEKQWSVLKYCVWIRISLDAGTPEMYRITHHVDTFDRVVANIAALTKKRQEGVRKPTIGAGYLVGAKTVSGMFDAAELGSTLGLDYMQFRPFHEATTDPDVPVEVLMQYRRSQACETAQYKVLWSEHKFRAMLKNPGAPSRPYDECYGHSFAAVVGADGNVYVCCHTRGYKSCSYGNIYKESFAQIWTGERRQQVIRQMDFKLCPLVCRCDSFNVILWKLRKEVPAHINFL